MPFIDRLKDYKSISTIGLEKNVGKTETLNYILKKLAQKNYKVALTSIGIDGENVDQVTATAKPEIYLPKGTLFVTSEKHYKLKRFQAEILDVSERTTALGRLITGRALGEGYILLSGPSNGTWVKEIIDNTLEKGADIMLVDGALSRLSVGSPIITEGIILSTGAAVSLNMGEVIKKTRHVINLLKLLRIEDHLRERIENLEDGIYLLGKEIRKLPIKSLLHFNTLKENIFKEGNVKLYITGVITERFIDSVSRQENIENIEIIAKDFTKIFTSPEVLNKYFRKGGRLKVVLDTKLIGITINPVAPSGYTLNSKELIDKLQEFIDVPVVNLREV